MQFFLFRHADKERGFTTDPALSQRGHKQAQKLAELVKNTTLPQPNSLLSSPKLRAQQSFQPLSQLLNIRMQTSPDFLERQSQESNPQFLSRIKNTISRIEKHSGVIFAVTHYDWIEEFLNLAPTNADFSDGQYHSWAPCQHMEFEIKDGVWHLLRFGSIDI